MQHYFFAEDGPLQDRAILDGCWWIVVCLGAKPKHLQSYQKLTPTKTTQKLLTYPLPNNTIQKILNKENIYRNSLYNYSLRLVSKRAI